MKLNWHKIRYKFSDDYSFLEVTRNAHNPVLVALVVIGLLALLCICFNVLNYDSK